MIGLAHFVLLTGIGALCSLDTVSVLEGMLSRPIVSATLGGAALGRPDLGIIAGVVMVGLGAAVGALGLQYNEYRVVHGA